MSIEEQTVYRIIYLNNLPESFIWGKDVRKTIESTLDDPKAELFCDDRGIILEEKLSALAEHADITGNIPDDISVFFVRPEELVSNTGYGTTTKEVALSCADSFRACKEARKPFAHKSVGLLVKEKPKAHAGIYTYAKFDASDDFEVDGLHIYAYLDKPNRGLCIFCTDDEELAFHRIITSSQGYPLSEYCYWCGNNDPSKLKLFCGRCKCVKYCSEKCKNEHYPAHKKCARMVGWDTDFLA